MEISQVPRSVAKEVRTNRKWGPILEQAAAIVRSYETSVTLRQLFYRLVSVQVLRNSLSDYTMLSKYTAEERRYGTFPRLADLTRSVHRPFAFEDTEDALEWLANAYRRVRTEGQPFQTWLIYEKATLNAQIKVWTESYGIPRAALRGYSSESLEREVFDQLARDGRDAVVFYVGDLDPEGEDIERNFRAQADAMGVTFATWERLAVTPAQVAQFGLVENPGKDTSTRAASFRANHDGELFQIEIEAIDPTDLEQLVTDAVTDPAIFDRQRWEESVADEERDKATTLARS